MPNTCTGVHFTCGETVEWLTSNIEIRTVNHVFNNKSSFMLGETEILVVNRKRDFNLSKKADWSLGNEGFLMRNEAGDLFACGESATVNTNSVSENYEYTTTELFFLDTRYNNAIGKEVIEKVTFSKAGDDMAVFKEPWGNGVYAKFLITNHKVTRTTNYFVVVKGQKTVLKTAYEEQFPNRVDNPLILVYPNPPSLSLPLDSDITAHGFYDYHAVGEGEGQAKIQRDGGDDFYFTDWMRAIGLTNRTFDAKTADNRYFSYYLMEGFEPTVEVQNPGIFVNSYPLGSIAVDSKGNVFYSVTFDGETFNAISEGDLAELLPTFVTDVKFFPIAPGA